ncbi:MAG: glycosyltransferase family 4 protein [Gaiellales bacterium]
MRVALVYRKFSLAGSLERDGLFLANALAAEGAEVHCYCDAARSEIDERFTIHDIRPLVVGQGRLDAPLERISFSARATRALRRERSSYDLVHVIGPDAWEHDIVEVHEVVAAAQRHWPAAAGRDFRLARARAALAPLTRPLVGFGRVVQSLQFRPGRFRRAIAVTEAVRRDLVETFGTPEELIDVIPPPVDFEAFRSARPSGLRQRLGVPPDGHLLLFVGHAFERKGLVDAISMLVGLPENAHLAVLGGGQAERYLARARDLGVEARVHFIGATQMPQTVFAEADVLVLPTRYDLWGIPLIEAMASEIPAVTTSAAGAAEVAEAAGAAIVVPPRAPRELAAAVGALLADPARRRRMAAAGPAAAVRFGRDAYARAVFATYDRALASPEAQAADFLAARAEGVV